MDLLTAILLTILIPSFGMLSNLVLRDQPNLRDSMTLVLALITFAIVLVILSVNGNDISGQFTLFEILPGLSIAFHVEPLGLMFAIIASGLWILTHLYGIGYMRGNAEDNHARFFASFAIAIGSVMGLSLIHI